MHFCKKEKKKKIATTLINTMNTNEYKIKLNLTWTFPSCQHTKFRTQHFGTITNQHDERLDGCLDLHQNRHQMTLLTPPGPELARPATMPLSESVREKKNTNEPQDLE